MTDDNTISPTAIEPQIIGEARPADFVPPTPPVAKPIYRNPRTQTVPLAYPFSLDGIEYETVTLRRITGVEAQKFIDQLTMGMHPRYPGVEMPLAAYEALDDDDLFVVDKAVQDFLPLRFRRAE